MAAKDRTLRDKALRVKAALSAAIPDKLTFLHLYKASFRQPIKFPNFGPRAISVLGGKYLVWGISTGEDYNVFIYVLSDSFQTVDSMGRATQATQAAVGVTVIIVGILAVLGLGLTIILFKNVEEVFGAGGLGITVAAGLGFAGFFAIKKFT